MCFTQNHEDRISIGQMNSELRQADLELLSAHCATHKLRLRSSTETVARHGRRDVLRKSIETASALSKYHSSTEKQIPAEETVSARATGLASGLSDKQVLQAVEYVSSFLRDQRERYLPSAAPLSEQHQAVMRPYFSAKLLDQVKVVELHGARVPNPPFYEEAKALGFVSLPDLTHMNSLTFLDVLVFNERLTQRSLFHALVHAVQFQVLGLKRYTEIFVHNFVNTRFHFRVPLEAHTFFLESKFARPASASFSVEDQVRLWVKQNRY
jgi:hypothetical protein